MIVLDEHLKGLGLEAAIGRWYAGRVVPVNALRPRTVVRDDSVPAILRRQKQATFVTLNWTDFWHRVRADPRYCLVYIALSTTDAGALPDILRRLFRTPGFATRAERAGKADARRTSERADPDPCRLARASRRTRRCR